MNTKLHHHHHHAWRAAWGANRSGCASLQCSSSPVWTARGPSPATNGFVSCPACLLHTFHRFV